MSRNRAPALTLILIFFPADAARADEHADMLEIVNKAIQSVGGEEKLARFKAEIFRAKGKMRLRGTDVVIDSGEWSVQRPDKLRAQVKTGDLTWINVVNSDKVWSKIGGMATLQIEDKEQIGQATEQRYADWVCTLVPLKGKEFTLNSAGVAKVGKKPAAGVRVSHKGHRDIELFFDKENGLLVKSLAKVVMSDEEGKPEQVTQEIVFSDYTEVNGVQRPWKISVSHDGKLFMEIEVMQMELKERLDDSLFSKP
jgi:hypothetical protein